MIYIFIVTLLFVIYLTAVAGIKSAFSLQPQYLKLKSSKKAQSDSAIESVAKNIEHRLFKTALGRKVLAKFENTKLPSQITPGYLLLLNAGLIFTCFNIANLLNLNQFMVFLSTALAEIFLLIFIAAKNSQKDAFNKSLPSLLDCLGQTYKVYPDLKNSLAEAQDSETDPTNRRVLARINNLVETGHTATEGLQIAAKEIDNPTFNFVTASISMHQTTGADISNFLIQTAAQLRKLVTTKKEIDQILFQNKISAIISASLAPIIFLLSATVSPNYRQVVFFSSNGRLIFILTAIWWAVGVFTTYKSITPRGKT